MLTALSWQRGETRDGEHGIRAPPAIPGSPGGFLAVELFESEVFDEGLHVILIDHNSFQRPPSEVEVPTQRDLFLSAVGGSGEPGRIGGDGEPGMDGTEGAPATRESDATVCIALSYFCFTDWHVDLRFMEYSQVLTGAVGESK